jgi:hypothetical protein
MFKMGIMAGGDLVTEHGGAQERTQYEQCFDPHDPFEPQSDCVSIVIAEIPGNKTASEGDMHAASLA